GADPARVAGRGVGPEALAGGRVESEGAPVAAGDDGDVVGGAADLGGREVDRRGLDRAGEGAGAVAELADVRGGDPGRGVGGVGALRVEPELGPFGEGA